MDSDFAKIIIKEYDDRKFIRFAHMFNTFFWVLFSILGWYFYYYYDVEPIVLGGMIYMFCMAKNSYLQYLSLGHGRHLQKEPALNQSPIPLKD